MRAKLPGRRYPEVAARRGAGRRRRSAPAASALERLGYKVTIEAPDPETGEYLPITTS